MKIALMVLVTAMAVGLVGCNKKEIAAPDAAPAVGSDTKADATAPAAIDKLATAVDDSGSEAESAADTEGSDEE